jgi:hypothetical protein
MTELLLHSRPVHTVFDLLGDKEDDIIYSFGWALAQSDRLVRRLLASTFSMSESETGKATALLLQETAAGAGRTDVEVQTEALHLILEAKRGWAPPTIQQLTQYTARFNTSRAARLLVVSECSPEYAAPRLPSESPAWAWSTCRGARSPRSWSRWPAALAPARPRSGCCGSSSAT